MEATEAQELLRVLKEAKDGYWMPFSLLAGSCTIIVALIIGWGRSIINNNNEEHKEMRELIKIQGEVNKGTLENQTALKDLMIGNKIEITKQKVKIENLEKKAG